MGPRLFRRGNVPDGQQGNHGVVASMGPRLFRRGNFYRAADVVPMPRVLQWGHVFSDVEISPRKSASSRENGLQWGHVFSDVEITRKGGLCDEKQTSMGPRLFRRGNAEFPENCQKANIFNGATSFGRGNKYLMVAMSCVLHLQWGHVFSDVEIGRNSGSAAV